MSPRESSRECQPPATMVARRLVPTDLTGFRTANRGWLEAHEGSGPVYRLPRQTIVSLTRPPERRPPLLAETDCEVEMAFTQLCDASRAIGYWQSEFIMAWYWVRPDPLPSATELRQLGLNWTRAQILQAQQLIDRTDSIAERIKGYAGWLVTDVTFIQARDDLASRWHALPPKERPYPIQRSVQIDVAPEESRQTDRRLAAFQDDMNAFLDLWGLTGMLTWDLPGPQGPMLPANLPANAPAMPRHGLHLVLPVHYPLTATDDLLSQIRQQQVALARELGIDTSMAGLPHYEVYGQMLEVDFLERTIRSRYDRPGRRRGLVTVKEHSIAETLEISMSQVQRLRKGISACRRGRRSSVRWLRTGV